jgi:hypothetical protein
MKGKEMRLAVDGGKRVARLCVSAGFRNGNCWDTPRQISYEWQGKDLEDTENERVRNYMKRKDENCGA